MSQYATTLTTSDTDQPTTNATLETSEPVGDVQQCRACGCTDDNCTECVERTGQPCYWVKPDLCSACDL
jgi:hypothetical protein